MCSMGVNRGTHENSREVAVEPAILLSEYARIAKVRSEAMRRGTMFIMFSSKE